MMNLELMNVEAVGSLPAEYQEELARVSSESIGLGKDYTDIPAPLVLARSGRGCISLQSLRALSLGAPLFTFILAAGVYKIARMEAGNHIRPLVEVVKSRYARIT